MNSLRSLLLDSQLDGCSESLNFVDTEVTEIMSSLLLGEECWSEYNEITRNIDHLCHIHGGLEEIQAIVEASLMEDGLDRSGATLLVSGTNALLRPLEDSVPMPSMEFFGGRGERIGSTQIALEALKEKIKEIWEAIKRAFKIFLNKLKDWFKNAFEALKKILIRCGHFLNKIEDLILRELTVQKENFDFNSGILFEKEYDFNSFIKRVEDFSEILISIGTGVIFNDRKKALANFEKSILQMNVDSPKDIVISMSNFYQSSRFLNATLKNSPAMVSKSILPTNYEKNKAFRSTDEMTFYIGKDLLPNQCFYYGEPVSLNQINFKFPLSSEDTQTSTSGKTGIQKFFSDENLNYIEDVSESLSTMMRMGWSLSKIDETKNIEKVSTLIKTPTILELKKLADIIMDADEIIKKLEKNLNGMIEQKKNLILKGDELARIISSNRFLEVDRYFRPLIQCPMISSKVIDSDINALIYFIINFFKEVLTFFEKAVKCYH